MKKIQKICCFFFAFILVLMTASCGQSDTQPNQEGTPEITMNTSTSEIVIPSVTDTPGGDPAVTYITFETERGTLVAPVIDIQTALNNQEYNFARIQEEMEILAELGFSRVYFVVATNGYGMACWPKWSQTEQEYISGYSYVLRNAKALGIDVNRLYITACKNAGMEAFVVYKPYEGGGTLTVPYGVEQLDESLGNVWVSALSGHIYHTDPFIGEHPEYRIQRKPDANVHEELPVTAIEVDFLLGSYSAGKTLYSNGVSESMVRELAQNYTLWVSQTNGAYVPYSGRTTCSFSVKTEEKHDRNGAVIGSVKCVTLRIEGLSVSYQDARYFALSFEDSSGLHTIPYDCFTLYSGTTMLSSTVTSFCRYPANAGDTPETHDWGNESAKPVCGSLIGGVVVGENGSITGIQRGTLALNGAEHFSKWGFEFGWVYDSEFAMYANSAVYGIARGSIAYIPGGLCEAYEEVREYWLSQVRKWLEYGADGIDIRPQSHSTMAIDYTNYGYNEPIVERYQELYGVDIRNGEVDYLKLAAIRGDFFLEFLKEASELTHSFNAVFSTHLVASYESPTLSTDVFHVGHFTEPKFILDWQKVVDLCDEITIKDNTYSTYNAALAREIRSYAKEKGKVVWVHSYLQQGLTDNKAYITAADKDMYADGILLYEMTFDQNYSPDLVEEIRDILESLYCKRVTHESKP